MTGQRTRTDVRYLGTTHLGATVTLRTLSAPGRCRKVTLTQIIPNHGSDTSTLIIGDHERVVPNGAPVYVEQAVAVNGL